MQEKTIQLSTQVNEKNIALKKILQKSKKKITKHHPRRRDKLPMVDETTNKFLIQNNTCIPLF